MINYRPGYTLLEQNVPDNIQKAAYYQALRFINMGGLKEADLTLGLIEHWPKSYHIKTAAKPRTYCAVEEPQDQGLSSPQDIIKLIALVASRSSVKYSRHWIVVSRYGPRTFHTLRLKLVSGWMYCSVLLIYIYIYIYIYIMYVCVCYRKHIKVHTDRWADPGLQRRVFTGGSPILVLTEVDETYHQWKSHRASIGRHRTPFNVCVCVCVCVRACVCNVYILCYCMLWSIKPFSERIQHNWRCYA